MTQLSKAAVEKANALVRAATPPNVLSSAKIDPSASYIDDAFARFIDLVSEVAKRTARVLEHKNFNDSLIHDDVSALILPDPEPDVLVEAIARAIPTGYIVGDRNAHAAIVADVVAAVRKVQP